MNGNWLEPIAEILPADRDGRSPSLVRLVLVLTAVLGILAVAAETRYARTLGVLSVSTNWRTALLVGWFLVGIILLLSILSWTASSRRWMPAISRIARAPGLLGNLALVFTALLSLVLPVILMGPSGRFLQPFFTRLILFWSVVLLGSWLTAAVRPNWDVTVVGASLVVLYGAAFRLALFRADLSQYPFSLGWSEASRYYYASLFLSERIYSLAIPPSVLHPSRYLLQALAFLMPGAGLPFHRAWQVCLWLGTTAVSGLMLGRRLRIHGKIQLFLFVLWAILWLFQGPVYYHLLLMVIAVIWLTDPERPLRTLFIVALASLWAGISRINWLPVPGMLASLMFFLETPIERRQGLRYLLWPIAWTVAGTVLAFASQSLYIVLSGNDPQRFGSSLTSQLLWNRLFPSATYPLGVLPAALLASLPAGLILLRWASRQRAKFTLLRFAGIVAVLGLLFGGGLVVSVKIGGGSNLHNMDAYLVALLITVSYVAAGRVKYSDEKRESHKVAPVFLVGLICLPVFFGLGMGKPIQRYDQEKAADSLASIRRYAQETAAHGDRVLFISQRQLLTFGYITGVELVPEYETVFLMEMAMSRNTAYLSAFHEDLQQQRYGLIVVDRLSTTLQGTAHNFAEENNAWVEEVSQPILCSYTVVDELDLPPVQLFVPRHDPCGR
jgi:hypothetical protein